MANALPITPDCCEQCAESVSVAVPGPAGAAGSNGSNGTNGVNAYTTTTASFNMPAEGANVTVSVADSTWMTPTQLVYVQNCGWMEVQSKPDGTSVILQNVENTGNGEYTDNVAPATAVANGSQISPGGLQGPAGADGASGAPDTASYWVSTNTPALASSVNIGLLTTGLVKVTVAAGTATPSTAVADTDYLSADAGLVDLAGVAMAADKFYYTTADNVHAAADVSAYARTILDDANAAAVRSTLGLGTAALEPVATFIQAANNLDDLGSVVTARTNLGIENVAADLIVLQDQKSAGSHGGAFTSGAWQQRDLNAEVSDTGNHCSLIANQFILSAGTYRIKAVVPAHKVGNHKARLYNITDATVELAGTSATSSSTDGTSNASIIEGVFTLASTKTLEIQHQCETTRAADGFGIGYDFGVAEIYTTVKLEREAG